MNESDFNHERKIHITIFRDGAEGTKAERVLEHEKHMLEMIVRGGELDQILKGLSCLAEEMLETKCLCSIYTADEDDRTLKHASGRNMPLTQADILAGNIGLGTSFPMTLKQYRGLAKTLNLPSGWCVPVFSTYGTCLGIVAIEYADHHVPSPDEIRIVERLSFMAGMAIEHKRNQGMPLSPCPPYHAKHGGQCFVYKFKKTHKAFIHTWCAGDLLYRLGFTPVHWIHKELKDLFPYHSHIVKELLVCYERAWSGDESVMYQGSAGGIDFELQFRPLRKNGVIEEVVTLGADITERNKMIQLQTQNEKYRSMAEQITNQLVLLISGGGVIEFATPSIREYLGYQTSEVIGKNLYQWIETEDLKELLTAIDEASGGVTVDMSCRIVDHNGMFKTMDFIIKPLHHALQTEMPNFLMIGKDADGGNGAANEKANGLKPTLELTAGFAHAIRNPLTTVTGTVQLLYSKGKVSDELFHALNRDIRHIENTVNEYIALSKIQGESCFQECDLCAIVEEVVADANLETSRNQYSFQSHEHEAIMLHCNRERIYHLLFELMTSVLEPPPDDVKVVLKLLKNPNHVVIKCVTVRSGNEIEPLEYAGRQNSMIKEKSAGLSLLVCRNIVDDHHGTLQLISKKEIGTKMIITFPTGETVKDLIVKSIDQFDQLTRREKEVLLILSRGKSNKEIAKTLEISEHTVKNHIANIFSKLGIFDRSQAIALLYQTGYKL